ncbi:hypothetical protein KM043_015090 [Ampulex compressa]|nr:hypothetical protein KM043_015090 [Ampulex compressa]
MRKFCIQYELADLKRQGITTACSIGETDVELFMEKAKTQNVTVCASLQSTSCILMVPIHQRYQYAKEYGGYENVIVPKPRLLLGCKNRIKEHRVSKIDLCSPCVDTEPKWREIPISMEEEEYTWLVPVGDSSLLTMVTYVTLLTTMLGAAFIIRTIWNSTGKEHQKSN